MRLLGCELCTSFRDSSHFDWIICDYSGLCFPRREHFQSSSTCVHNDKPQNWVHRTEWDLKSLQYPDPVLGWKEPSWFHLRHLHTCPHWRTGARQSQTQCIWLNNEARVMAKPNNFDKGTHKNKAWFEPNPRQNAFVSTQKAKVEW